MNAFKSKISAGKKLKNEANVETTAGLGRFVVFFPLWFYLDDQSSSLIIIFFSGKTQTHKDEIRRRLFFTTRPAELTDEEVDGHHVPGHYCFCFHSCAHASIHNGNQVLANIGKEPTKKEVRTRREFCSKTKKWQI